MNIASNQDDAIAQSQWGERFGVPLHLDPNLAFTICAAKSGHPEAQHRLGACFLHGAGLKPDPKVAAEWLWKAAEQGYVPAQGHWGFCLKGGHGVAQNPTESLKWFKEAALKGNAVAEYELGLALCFGEGAKQSFAEGLRWLKNPLRRGTVRHARLLVSAPSREKAPKP